MYLYTTATGNCRKHLRLQHAAIYDEAVLKNKWPYRLSTEDPLKATLGQLRKSALPPFSSRSFIDYLVCFVVADDQVHNSFYL